MTVRVLATRGLSNVRDAIDLIHQAMVPAEFHLGASYATQYTPLRLVADSFYLEPSDGTAEAYVEWLLALCREQDFRWVWPQSRWSLLLGEQDRFRSAGVGLILPCPNGELLAEVQDKSRANTRLAAAGVPLPQTWQITTSAEFVEAMKALNQVGRQGCVKPIQSIYGLGFRLIDDSQSPLDRLLANDTFAISAAEFVRLLDMAQSQRPFLMMEYLTGDERSIDCLACHGRLIRAVVRRKPAGSGWRWQLIETDSEAWEIARRAIAAFELNGLVNVQTRERISADGRREQCFLEVNPRMSGGIYLSCESGLNLPYWLLRSVAHSIDEAAIPHPATGVRVAKIERAVSL